MPNLNADQIKKEAKAAGFKGNDLYMAVAVALAESNGNPTAYNPELAAGTPPGHGSRGLWQIYGNVHPEYDSDLMYDPAANAKAAFTLYKGRGGKFTDWSTYNNGQAAAIYSQLTKTNPTNPGGLATGGDMPPAPKSSEGPTNKPTSSGLPTIDISLLPSAITDALIKPEFGVNVLFGIIGGVLIFLGVIMLIAAASQVVNESAPVQGIYKVARAPVEHVGEITGVIAG